jgi:hypothetical protein
VKQLAVDQLNQVMNDEAVADMSTMKAAELKEECSVW